MSPPRVLFVNHTGEMAGAERSLLDLLSGLPGEQVATVACPRGELLAALRAGGQPVAEIPATDVSFRPHPVHTVRGLGRLAANALRLRQIAQACSADVLHANTERAGLSAVLAARMGCPPVIVHARARLPDTRLGTLTARALTTGAAAIVANSNFTAEPLRAARAIEVIHNPIDTGHYDLRTTDRRAARSALGLTDDDEILAVIGYLAPVKRQDDAIRVLARLKPRHPRARLVLAGAARFTGAGSRTDSRAYAAGLTRLVAELDLGADVLLLGEQEDVRPVLAAADVVLVPSEEEGFGRVVLEGIAAGKAVVATSNGGTGEIIRNDVDGLLLPPRDPETWAEAVSGLLADPVRRGSLGASGRERARAEFGLNDHVSRVRALYERVVAR